MDATQERQGKNEHPPIKFWGEGKPITFVNPTDFDREALLKKLGLSGHSAAKSFGISDRDEILRRQRIIKFLLGNPKLRGLLAKGFPGTAIPFMEQDFLDYFNPKRGSNAFWSLLAETRDSITQAGGIPAEVSEFLAHIDEMGFLENLERKMATGIAQEVQKAAYLEGSAEVSVENLGYENGRRVYSVRMVDANVFGYKLCSFTLTNKRREEGAEDIRKPRGWLGKLFFKIRKALQERFERQFLYSPLIIRQLHWSIHNAIQNFFVDLPWHELVRHHDYKDRIAITVEFQYDQDGLRIKLLQAEFVSEEKRHADWYAKPIRPEMFPGYSQRELRKVSRERGKRELQIALLNRARLSQELEMAIISLEPNLLENGRTIESPQVDDEFKWFAIKHLIEDPRFSDTYNQAASFRSWVNRNLYQLRMISEIAEAMLVLSQKWGIRLCFPEILDDGHHLVEFQSLHPIHLIGTPLRQDEPNFKATKEKVSPIDARDLVPLREIPALNGDMIGFTGQNAGGKSTAMQAIIEAIYLAQSGLPVFGQGFRLNVKETIGAVFIERGDGSTCQLMLEKHKALLKALAGCETNSIVLFLDEVGTGTQEAGGLQYGRMLLKKLAGSGCSIIFSTQIVDLAEYSQKELGARCFKFSLDHSIQPGIGLGGIDLLMEKVGITEFLE